MYYIILKKTKQNKNYFLEAKMYVSFAWGFERDCRWTKYKCSHVFSSLYFLNIMI